MAATWGNTSKREKYEDYNIEAIWKDLKTRALEEDLAATWDSVDLRNDKNRSYSIKAIWNKLGVIEATTTSTETTVNYYNELKKAIKHLWGINETSTDYEPKNGSYSSTNITKIWEALDNRTTVVDFSKAIRNLWGKEIINSTNTDTYEPGSATTISTRNINGIWNAIKRLWGTTDTNYEDTNYGNKNIAKIWNAIQNLWGLGYDHVSTIADYTNEEKTRSYDIQSLWAETKSIWDNMKTYFQHIWGLSASSTGYEDTSYSDRSIKKIWDQITIIWGGETTKDSSTGLGHRVLDTTYEDNLKIIWGSDDTSVRIQSNGITNRVLSSTYNTEIGKIWGSETNHSSNYGIGSRVLSSTYTAEIGNIWGSETNHSSNYGIGSRRTITDCNAEMNKKVNTETLNAELNTIWGTITGTTNRSNKNIEQIWNELGDRVTKSQFYQQINRIWSGSDTSASLITPRFTEHNIETIWTTMKTQSACTTDMNELKSRLNKLENWTSYNNPNRVDEFAENGTMTPSLLLNSALHIIYWGFSPEFGESVSTTDSNTGEAIASFARFYHCVGPDMTKEPNNWDNSTNTRTVSSRLAAIEFKLGMKVGPEGAQLQNSEYAAEQFNITSFQDRLTALENIVGSSDSSITETLMARVKTLETQYDVITRLVALVATPGANTTATSNTSSMNTAINNGLAEITSAIDDLRDSLKSAIADTLSNAVTSAGSSVSNAVTIAGDNIRTGENSIEAAIKNDLSKAVTIAGDNIRTGENSIEAAIKNDLSKAVTIAGNQVSLAVDNALRQLQKDHVDVYTLLSTQMETARININETVWGARQNVNESITAAEGTLLAHLGSISGSIIDKSGEILTEIGKISFECKFTGCQGGGGGSSGGGSDPEEP